MENNPPSRPVSAATTSKLAHQRSHSRNAPGIPQRPPSRRLAHLQPVSVPTPPAERRRAPSTASRAPSRTPSVAPPTRPGTTTGHRPPSRPGEVTTVPVPPVRAPSSRPASVAQSLRAPSVQQTPGTATTIKAPTPKRPADLERLERESQQGAAVPVDFSQTISDPPLPVSPDDEPPLAPQSTRSDTAASSTGRLTPLYSPLEPYPFRGSSEASWGEASQQLFAQGTLEYMNDHPSILEFYLPASRLPTEREKYVAGKKALRAAQARFYAEQSADREHFERAQLQKERFHRDFSRPPSRREFISSLSSSIMANCRGTLEGA